MIERTEKGIYITVLIESDWNLKFNTARPASVKETVLIESDWNLRIFNNIGRVHTS